MEDLEEVLREGLGRVTGSLLDAGQRALASLRLKDGGIAFGGFRGRSAPAFLGSWGMVFQELASGIGVATLEGFSSRCPTVWAEIGRAEQSLRVLGGNGGRALDWGQMIDEPAGKLQGTWAKEISENRREAILWSLREGCSRRQVPWGARCGLIPLPALPGRQGHARPALHRQLARSLAAPCVPGRGTLPTPEAQRVLVQRPS